VDARQTFTWLLVSELEMAPTQWGRPLRGGDVRAIAHNFDPDKLGAIAIWSRPNLPIGRGRFVILDGQHRVAGVRLIGYTDQRVPCLVYENLTMETAAELSLGLQERRNLHPLDKFRAMLSAHDRRAVEIDKALHTLGLELTYNCRSTDRGRLSAVSALHHIWDLGGMALLERTLNVCGQAWDHTAAGYSSNIMRLVVTVVNAHDGDVDDVHLGETLATRSPAQWLSKDSVPKRPISSLAQDVIVEYNKGVRGGNRLTELTRDAYERAYKRTASPTKRGKIQTGEQHLTKASASRGPRRRPVER